MSGERVRAGRGPAMQFESAAGSRDVLHSLVGPRTGMDGWWPAAAAPPEGTRPRVPLYVIAKPM